MSDWIQHVKAVAQKLGLNYAEALRDPRTKMSYRKLKGGKFSFSQLAKDTGNISKKILRTGVPAMMGIGATMEGGPVAGLAAAKASGELTNYLTGGKKHKKPKMMLKDVKQLCKQNKIKLSMNGKPLNKKQLLMILDKHNLLSGGKFNLGKAKKITDYAASTASKGFDVAKKGAEVYDLYSKYMS